MPFPNTLPRMGRPPISPMESAFRLRVAEGLLSLREQMGWTRVELASLLFDVSVADLQRWETQVSLPKGLHMLRIIRLLDLDMSDVPPGAFKLSAAVRNQAQLKIGPLPVIDIGLLLKALRLQRGQSVKQLTEQWGIPATTYQNWERGFVPSIAHAGIVARELKLPMTAIGNLFTPAFKLTTVNTALRVRAEADTTVGTPSPAGVCLSM